MSQVDSERLWQRIYHVNNIAQNILDPLNPKRWVENWETIDSCLTDMVEMLQLVAKNAMPEQRSQILEWLNYAAGLLLHKDQVMKLYFKELLSQTDDPIYLEKLPSKAQEYFLCETRVLVENWIAEHGTHDFEGQVYTSMQFLKVRDLRPFLIDMFGMPLPPDQLVC